MTKEVFLIVSDLLTGYDFDELDKVEFFMGYERKSNTKIPDGWFAEAQLKELKPQTDWSAFRRDAAKDILANVAGQLVHDSTTIAIDEFDPEFYAKVAVEWADALIAKLKEK